jgi:uncharacterized repeat protein (TIGR03803 family)
LFILRPFLKKILNLSKKKALVGWIGSLSFATQTPQPALAAPAITLKASFDGANGYSLYAPLTPAGNGLFYGTTFSGGDNNAGSIFEFDPSGSGSITTKVFFDFGNGADATGASGLQTLTASQILPATTPPTGGFAGRSTPTALW